MSKQVICVTTRTQPGKREEVRQAYLEHLAPRAEANEEQELIVWAADDADPDVFHLFEMYSSAEAMQANSQQPWFFEYLGLVGPLLAGEPEVVTAAPGWSKGLG